MVNRINIFKPDTPMGYDDRIRILKQRKLEETQAKSKMKVYQDGDDYGSIPAPENYQFHCIPNHENGSWFHQLNEKNDVIGSVWPGNSDLYHAFQATWIPYGNAAVSIASDVKQKMKK